MLLMTYDLRVLHSSLQVQHKITQDQLSQALEQVDLQLEAGGTPSQNRDRHGRTKVTPITEFLKRPSAPAQYPPRSDLQKMVDINVAIFLATANLPFQLVERPSFKRFVASLNPRAVIKSRTTYARNSVMLVYKNLKEQLDILFLNDLPSLDLVSFTTDLWQSRTTDDYISLTIHYIDGNWQMKHFNVECRPYSDAHSGVLIGHTIDLMIREVQALGTETKKIMTTDGAANMKKACDESDEVGQQLLCLNHIINLAFKDACNVPAVSSMVKLCKDLASACHYSTKRTNLIREKCKELEGELNSFNL